MFLNVGYRKGGCPSKRAETLRGVPDQGSGSQTNMWVEKLMTQNNVNK